MEIREHAKERFVERILNIDRKEVKQYVKANNAEVSYSIMELINSSNVLYKSYAPSRGETLDYYINGETLIVVAHLKPIVYTMFDITLDADDHKNVEKIRQYVKKITQNNNKVAKINSKQKAQDVLSKKLEYLIERTSELLSKYVTDQFKKELDDSINMCKELAAEAKSIRMENRDLMDDIFKKLENGSE